MCGIKIFGQTLTLYNFIFMFFRRHILFVASFQNPFDVIQMYHIDSIHCIHFIDVVILSPQNCPGGPPAWGVGDEVYSRRCPVLCRPQHKDHNIPGPAGRPGQRVRTLILKTNRALTLQCYMGITQQTITQTVLLWCRQCNMMNIHMHKGKISVSALEC